MVTIPDTKACKACGIQKPLSSEFFQPQKLGKYGFTARCKECRKLEDAERRERPDQKARQQAWRDANKDYTKAYNLSYRQAGYKSTRHVAQWRSQNREYCREYERLKMRRYRAANPEKYRAMVKASYYRNHEATLERGREWTSKRYRSCIKFNLKAKVSGRLRAMLKGCGGKSRARTEAILGYTLQEFAAHIERQFTKGMTWQAVLSGEIEIDHITPVVAFDVRSINDPDLKACWALSNLRPVWKRVNRSKGKAMHFLL